MPEDLRDAIAASVDTGDTAPAATASEPTPAAAETTETTETTQPADTAEATGEAEWKIDSADFDAQHPELAPLRKQLQADYTRKQQEAAERLRLIDGLDEGSVQWMRQVRQLAQTNPEIAAQLLEQERQKLLGGGQPQRPPDPLEQQEWLSDGERLLHERLRKQEEVIQQMQATAQRSAVEAEFSQLERTIGKPLSEQERTNLLHFCAANNVNLTNGWKLQDYDRAVQRGRDEAAGVLRQKATLGAAPSGVASREAPAANREPKNRREAIMMAYEEAERRTA